MNFCIGFAIGVAVGVGAHRLYLVVRYLRLIKSEKVSGE